MPTWPAATTFAVNAGRATTVKPAVLLACWPKPSVTRTVNEKDPATVGVPLSCPVVALRARPAGRLPALTAQANGPVPPPRLGC